MKIYIIKHRACCLNCYNLCLVNIIWLQHIILVEIRYYYKYVCTQCTRLYVWSSLTVFITSSWRFERDVAWVGTSKYVFGSKWYGIDVSRYVLHTVLFANAELLYNTIMFCWYTVHISFSCRYRTTNRLSLGLKNTRFVSCATVLIELIKLPRILLRRPFMLLYFQLVIA